MSKAVKNTSNDFSGLFCDVCLKNNWSFYREGEDRIYYKNGVKFQIINCDYCFFKKIYPQPTVSELLKYYPKEYDQYDDLVNVFVYGGLSRFFIRLIKFLKTGKSAPSVVLENNTGSGYEGYRFLDIGCGSGSYLENIRVKYPMADFYGLDLSPEACQITSSKGFKVFCGSILDSVWPDEFFDEINMSHVIEHLYNPRLELGRVFRMLKPGGKIVISTPNSSSLTWKIFKSYWFAQETPRHLHLFNPENLVLMLQDIGFIYRKVLYSQSPKVLIQSLYLLIGKKDLRINPFVWRFFLPISKLMFLVKRSDVFTLHVTK